VTVERIGNSDARGTPVRIESDGSIPPTDELIVDLRTDSSGLTAQTQAASEPRIAADAIAPYARRALISDALGITFAITIAIIGRFAVGAPASETLWVYAGIGLLVGAAWLATLGLSGAYEHRYLGVGTDEFKRVIVGTAALFGLVGTVSYILKADVSRGFVLIALPLGLIALLIGRAMARKWLYQQRKVGAQLSRTLIIGYPHQTEAMAAVFDGDPGAGFHAVAAHRPPIDTVEGWIQTIEALIEREQVDAIAMMQSDHVTDDVIRRLSWQIEGRNIDLLVAPTLGDISGPRLTFRPAAGLPLIHLDEPHLTGSKQITKRGLDIIGATSLLILISPILLVIALLVRFTSRGPVIFRQQRVGRNGELFTMLKFRTMVDGADRLHEQAIAEALAVGSETTLATDSRITKPGRFLRRWSLDELPQLINVVNGTMSIVGPRPLLLSEADDLPEHIQRRHLTKPGLTGLWQISGRKGTTWDERMRLDLYYVENWSPALDVVILLKTAKAVVSGTGAY
jgi:exopolysaccharide biosynthesis polyprenyl glycosylphosphotransferase